MIYYLKLEHNSKVIGNPSNQKWTNGYGKNWYTLPSSSEEYIGVAIVEGKTLFIFYSTINFSE